MQKLAKFGFALWCLWLVVQLVVAIAHSPGRGATAFAWGATFGAVPMIAGGSVLTWSLAKRPCKSLAVALAILIAVLLWKFYLGEIVFAMHPQLGGYTFLQSVSVWLSRNTASVAHFVLWFPPMMLLAGSLVFYPIYCIIHEDALGTE